MSTIHEPILQVSTVEAGYLKEMADLRRHVQQLEDEIRRLQDELEQAHRTPRRRHLPDTRHSVTHKFTVGDQEGYLTVGLFEDESPGEIFLTMSKEGSLIGGLTNTIGILTSMALQYGVPVETLAHKFEYTNFEPCGWTLEPGIHRASSIVDYVFRWLGLQFSESYRQDKLPAEAPLVALPNPVNEINSGAVQEELDI